MQYVAQVAVNDILEESPLQVGFVGLAMSRVGIHLLHWAAASSQLSRPQIKAQKSCISPDVLCATAGRLHKSLDSTCCNYPHKVGYYISSASA